MSEMVERKRPALNWKLWAKIGVSVLVLGYIFHGLKWDHLKAAILHIHGSALILPLALGGLTIAGVAWRWKILLQIQNISLSYRHAASLTFIGQFFNSFLPGATGGDVIRVYYMLRYVPDQKARAMLSIVMDRFFGLAALLALAGIAIPLELPTLMSHNETRPIPLLIYGLLGATVCAFLFPLFFPHAWIPAVCLRLWNRLPYREVGENLLHGFREHGRSFHLSCAAFVLSLLIHSNNFLICHFLAGAFGLTIPLSKLVVIVSLALCAAALPISFGGLGVRELAFKQLFVLFLIVSPMAGAQPGEEDAIAFSLVFFSLSVFWSLVGGLVYLGYSHALKAHDTKP